MDLNGKKLILSSASPRRKELLAGLGVDFSIDTNTSFIEHYDPNTPLEEIPALMAEGKSEGFHRELAAGEILLTSDTMVYCDGLVMGKPDGREGACYDRSDVEIRRQERNGFRYRLRPFQRTFSG